MNDETVKPTPTDPVAPMIPIIPATEPMAFAQRNRPKQNQPLTEDNAI